VAEWNLARFAEALLPLIADDQEQAIALAVEALGGFRWQYSATWSAGMRAKLGLAGGADGADDTVVLPLVDDLLTLLQENHVDYTTFFRSLGSAARGDTEPARRLVLDLAAFDAWARRWLALGPDVDAMARVNPAYIPRNHLVEEALDAATDDDLDPVRQLLDAVTNPYAERPGLERYTAAAPEDFASTYRTFCGT
jgi:uncharacterized protein YdiU (UPF0061 family)